jgi:SAM-dependent methyltransferase
MARFAGSTLPAALPGGRLYACGQCNSLQRSPILSEGQYGQLYGSGSDEVWTGEARRPDHERVAAFIRENGIPASLLDVGCNTGRFLNSLPSSIRKFGVEPSRQASAVARKMGINVLADDVTGISSHMLFDCITLIDVIEHVPDPGKLLDQLIARLAPGGRLVISTGDPECTAWREMYKSKFWYCSFAEHISFPSRKWLMERGAEQGCSLELSAQFRYGDFGTIRTFVKWMFQTVYKFFPPLSYLAGWALLRERLFPFARTNLFLPCAGLYRDHHIISLLAPESK